MATLTNDDYKQLRQIIYRAGHGKEELKARANLPNKSQLMAGFQALEDKWSTDRLAYKTVLDVALGVTTTADEARFFFEAWLENRRSRGL